ncbi:hypothetical protein A5780_19195 [Nocardia sp. 852002-20019_SCH5090214]|uniref:hypothetical protein n=1 Tax=Nocardia sp. 852002-20019_SCH5090214 TaxID=1834087 RepID=UPI0007EBDBC9|nr:hypothetical protein [Nocardia sp. 852002-20019_SCH5090214]OBA62187.1 hypothetical protein A5780_19195 [Nocardia sp. 852002-20019_SCH5090214]
MTAAPANRRRRATKKNTDDYVRDDFSYMVTATDGDSAHEVEVRLPSLTYLKPGQVRRMRKLSQVDAFYTLLEETLDDEALAAVDDMDPDEFRDMLDKWREHSGVNEGESSASQG